jgi:hypothetical protein
MNDRTITMELLEGGNVNVEIGPELAHSDIAWMLKVLDAHLQQKMIESQDRKGLFELWDLPEGREQ